MNATQRKELGEMTLNLSKIQSRLEDLQGEEQEKFDNLSEGLQSSEKGETIAAAAEALQESIDSLQTCIDKVEEATST